MFFRGTARQLALPMLSKVWLQQPDHTNDHWIAFCLDILLNPASYGDHNNRLLAQPALWQRI
ncbi:MAG: hypothetical protein JXI43_07895, partial [Tissierellales bacterium]|nr:hypothetical protein [Tissierellales bacterium]